MPLTAHPFRRALGLSTLHMDINVLSELERIGLTYEWAGEVDVKCKCPFHDDSTASCSVSTEKRVFRCHACGAKGDFISFLARALKTDRGTLLYELGERYGTEVKTVDPDLIERYHKAIWDAGPLLKALTDRAVSEKSIRKYRLGENRGRIQIPIKNEAGLYVNVRKYLPGAPGGDKMKNMRGRGKMRLYPMDQLKYDELVICGGEIKAIAVAEKVNKFNIGAVCATGGENNWDHSFTHWMRDKHLWVCMDIDTPGQVAAQSLCAQLATVSSWVGNVKLPLDEDEYPHGDVNDYLAKGGKLHALLKKTPEWVALSNEKEWDEEPIDADLISATASKNTGKRIRLKVIISAMDTAPYVIPSKVKPICDKSQKECGFCPVFVKQLETVNIPPEHPAIIEMVASPKAVQRDSLMSGAGIPKSCEVVEFEVIEYFNVEDARLSPRLEITNRAVERVMLPALCIGTGMEANETYEMVGRMYPHPKTQQTILLMSEHSATQDALSTYKSPGLDRLSIFQPKTWDRSGLDDILDYIYRDLEANVTRIFQRRDLHLVVDLTYHSPLFIKFDGRVVKGWVESLVVGDSAQGKTETTANLMRHYQLGEKVECKNASVAGLLGGLQQMGSRWFVTWGVIPTHDKRLVILEELKGASYEVIGKLTDMRSSGIAEIPKIEKRRTHARTRLIALSNPRGDLPVSAHNFGIECVKQLIGNLEDVRRFDIALLVASGDIDSVRLNSLVMDRPVVEHVFTGDLCRDLILWAWTRSPDQVVFENERGILEATNELCATYTDAIPLVDRGSMRFKLGRLAAALACRTFSTEDGETVLVKDCHVQYIADKLNSIYGSNTFGYKDFTKVVRMTETLVDEKLIKKRLNVAPFPGDFVEQLLHTARIELVDIQDWNAWERRDSMEMLSFLVRKRALVRDQRAYRKTPPFIALLKHMQQHDEVAERPKFIEEEF